MAAKPVTRPLILMREKGEAGLLVLAACVGMVLLAGAGICSRTPVSSSPLSGQPLVLSYKYCGCRQEFVVEAGRDFHVSSNFDKGVLVADGRIHSVVGNNCLLNLVIEYRFKSGTAESARLDEHPLKIGQPSLDSFGAHGSACMMTGPWIRRGIDPVPSLVRALRPDYRDYLTAITELKRLGADGAGAAYERTVPAWSAIALGDIGPAASAAVPALLETLKDENPRTQIFAASALWKIGRHPAAVPTLVQQLTAADWEIRSLALAALAEIGVGAPTAAPALTVLLTTDEKPFIRQKAAGVLWRSLVGAT